MIVGTGVGVDKEKRIKSLAHGLLKSIDYFKPDHIIFFVSEYSKNTVKSLKIQYKERHNKVLENYECVELNNVDKFDECFDTFKEMIKKYDNNDCDVKIDYTSGTKTMTAAIAIVSMIYRKTLVFVGGTRGNGLVISGTESVNEQNLYGAYDKLDLDKFKELFDSYRFKTSKEILNQITVMDNKDSYHGLVECYDCWDKFNHDEIDTSVFDNFFKTFPEIKTQLVENIRSLKKIQSKDGDYILADLLNNAKRRIEERKFDDTVARLYRSVELISQIKLKSLGLVDDRNFKENNVFYVDKEKLKNRFHKTYNDKIKADRLFNHYIDKDFSTKKDKSYFKLASDNNYRLLSDLKIEFAERYLNDKSFKSSVSKRNDSILAHGLKSIDDKTANKLFDKILEYSKDFNPKIDEYMESAKFPKLSNLEKK
jgi:CRISPR-associated protein (TIGR02710 family)